jgi:TonB family protein
MGAEDIARAARRRNAVAQRTLAVRRAQQRRFRIGLACAAVLHAALFVGVGTWSSPRQLGEPDASPDGIAVELVDAADLMSPNTVQMPPINTGSVAPPPQPPQPPQQQPEPPAEAEPPPPPVPAPALKKVPAVEKATEMPSPAEQPKKQTSKAPPTKSASLQPPHDALELSLPDAAFAPMGRSAAFARPPNITRSGENDEFGRGVVRALRRTMPASDTLGQVTIKFLLTETGNMLEAQLIRSGGNPIMDQNVLFAAKQSSFPIPPAGATIADRTFLVTYIYR